MQQQEPTQEQEAAQAVAQEIHELLEQLIELFLQEEDLEEAAAARELLSQLYSRAFATRDFDIDEVIGRLAQPLFEEWVDRLHP